MYTVVIDISFARLCMCMRQLGRLEEPEGELESSVAACGWTNQFQTFGLRSQIYRIRKTSRCFNVSKQELSAVRYAA